MEFDRTNSNQNTIKPTNRARFHHGAIPSQPKPSYPNRTDYSDMPCSSDNQGVKKMEFDSSESDLIRSVLTGEVTQQKSSSKKRLFNTVDSTSAVGTSTIEEETIHNSNRGGNFTSLSEQPSVFTMASVIDEETVYNRRKGSFPSFLKPSTTTAMPGREEETVYNGKRGGVFFQKILFQEQTDREEEKTVRKGAMQATENGPFKPSSTDLVASQAKGKTIHFETSIQECSVSNGEANNQAINGVNEASISGSGQKRRRDTSESIRVPADNSGQSEMPPDGYRWWKYGEKRIKGSSYRRYYKCKTRSNDCSAKKQVMRATDDPSMLDVTYKKKHNHPPLENLINSINVTPHAISHAETNHLPAPAPVELKIDINLPAPSENEMCVASVVPSNVGTNRVPVLAEEPIIGAPQFFKFL